MSLKAFDFSELPPELWHEIFSLIDPLNLLTLSEVSFQRTFNWTYADCLACSPHQTCRSMRRLVTDKSVWVRILEGVALKYDVFPPTYPIPSMDLAQLQRASLCPSRWDRLVDRHSVPPSGTQPDPVSPLDTITAPMPGNWHYLTPGGRFMVSGSTLCSKIQLWDLGLPGTAALERPILVASVGSEVAGQPTGSRCLVGCSVGTKIRVALIFTSTLPNL